jgi:DNA polymerase III delta subunit
MSLVVVAGPSNAGPGERERMLETAAHHFENTGVARAQVVRLDVPGRGAGDEGEGSLRAELEPMIPLLQSGSLFGEREGLQLVDAQNLQKAEAEILSELLEGADLDATEVVLISAGALPRSLAGVVKQRGETVKVAKIWERDVAGWLASEARSRKIDMDRGAVEALVQRYGTDTAGMSRALDQLAEIGGMVTADIVLVRFRNRPDEPPWHITDAIGRGDVGEALRRLSDFLVHGHPLVYLATLESDLKRRSLALAAPNEATFKEWAGSGTDRQLGIVWRNRGRVKESSLRSAQQALLKADRVVKSQPEDVHRVTLERLTVAMCRWYG